MELQYYLLSQLDYLLSIGCIIAAIRIGKVALSLLIASFAYFIQIIVDNSILDKLSTLDSIEQHDLIAIWYTSFAMTDMLLILAVYSIHRATATPFHLFSRLFVYITTFTVVLRMARCTERLFFDSYYLQLTYQWGIPVTNFLLLGSLALGLAFIYRRSRDFEERIAWHS